MRFFCGQLRICVWLVVLSGLIANPIPCLANPPKPLKVLLITGGCCHDYPAQKELLKKGLELRAFMDVEVVYQGGSTTDARIPLYEKANWSEGFDVVIHDECFADVKDNNWTKQILKPHQEGLPAVVMHCAMHCYRDGTPDWFEFCGVTSHGHGSHYPHEVLTRDGEHPIMQTLGAGWMNPAGELYHIERVWPTARAIASAKSRERGNEHAVAWVNEYGPKKTRVFGTTLGHHNVTVDHPAFLDLVTRGTLWACGKLGDEYLKPSVPVRVPVNLAKGKTASASSEETGKNNVAGNAFDDNEATRWCASSFSFPESLQVDLGKVVPITGIDLKWESQQTYRYQLHGSDDGKDWRLLVDRSKIEEPRNHEDLAANVRHVKLTVTGSNQGGWASLFEVRVTGTETVTIDSRTKQSSEDQQVLKDAKIPDGFDATVFAAPPAVLYPVSVASSPDGVIYVAVDKNGSLDRQPYRGSIYRLRDINGDGRADESKLFVGNVDSPRGLVWDRDRLYVMHPPHLSAFIDKDGDGIADEQKILVKGIAFDFKDRPADHTSNGVTLGIDGWLYLAIGDFGFMHAEGTDGRTLQFRGGGVVRVRPDGSNIEIYSRGTRNILEVGLDPLLNGFTRDNTNDGDGWDIRLHHFTGLDHHGYPSLFKNFSDEIVKPLADYGGGSGCGAYYVDEPGFPEGFGNAMYTADWGHGWVYRHQMTANGATFRADQNKFVGLPRVTDLDVDAKSHLYFTSWNGATFTYNGEEVGYLLRLSPKGYEAPKVIQFANASNQELLGQLRTSSHRKRLAAQRELLSRGLTPEVQSGLNLIVNDSKALLASRVAAIYALTLGGKANDLNSIAADPSKADKFKALLPWILKSLSESFKDGQEPVSKLFFVHSLRSEDPRTRLEAIAAVVRGNRKDVISEIVPLLNDTDPIVSHTAFQAMVILNGADACFEVVDHASDALTGLREGALRVLRQLHDPVVVDGLIERLERETVPGRRLGLFVALCRLHQREGTWKGNSWGTRPDTTGPYYQPETWEKSTVIAAALKRSFDNAESEETAQLLTEMSQHKISLDGALEQLLAIAEKDPKLISAAVKELIKAKTVPAAAIDLLRRVAENNDSDADLRANAVAGWLRTKDATSFGAILDTVAQLGDAQKNESLERVWSLLLQSDQLSPHVDLLRQKATEENNSTSVVATAGLLALVSSKQTVSPEVRTVAQKTISELSLQVVQRRNLLEALRKSNQRDHSSLVLDFISDSDAGIATLAKEMAKQWNLDLSPTPRGPMVQTMKTDEVVAAVQKLTGNSARGEALFTKLNCGKCHTVKAGEPLRGPYLPNVAKTYKRDQLAESILLPSKSLAQGFVTYIFAMDNGKSYTGFITAEAADEITIRDAEGKEIKLPVAQIDERVKSTVSVMPEGLAKELTIEEFAALIAYLESLAK